MCIRPWDIRRIMTSTVSSERVFQRKYIEWVNEQDHWEEGQSEQQKSSVTEGGHLYTTSEPNRLPYFTVVRVETYDCTSPWLSKEQFQKEPRRLASNDLLTITWSCTVYITWSCTVYVSSASRSRIEKHANEDVYCPILPLKNETHMTSYVRNLRGWSSWQKGRSEFLSLKNRAEEVRLRRITRQPLNSEIQIRQFG